MAVGVLLAFTAEATARGRLGLNSFMGLRFGYLVASDEAWYAGHRAARIPLVLSGVVVFIAGVILMLAQPNDNAANVVVGVAMGVLLLLVIVAAVIGNRAARDEFARSLTDDAAKNDAAV